MARPAAFIERYRRWAYAMRDAFREILAIDDYRYGFDPYWVRAEPYRSTVRPGEAVEVTLHLRNFLTRPQRYRLVLQTPSGLRADPGEIEIVLEPEARRQVRLRLQVEAEAGTGVRLVAFDVTRDGQRLGQWFDAVIEVRP